ncbi:MAG TPA: PIG-L deacetylase family protein [Terriglobia bacterium]|nr:PIG-L deacetylase family protein [Terriglobia bacterium]
MEITRRNLLISAGIAMSSLGSAASGVSEETSSTGSAPDRASRKMKIVISGGHPGDPEYGCGGTVARMAALGHEVVLLYLNNGAWPPTSAPIRVKEAAKACKILKARPAYADQINGHAIVDNAHYDDFQKIIAKENPDAVLTQWPIDNHPDHRATFNLTYNAWQKLGKKFALYYYEVSDGEDTLQYSPNRYIDITDTEPIKRQACYAHASQSPDMFYALQTAVAKFRGIECGYKQAEAFVWQTESPYDIFSGNKIITP